MVRVKLVFQGGGAKLVTLMAAASVVQELEAEGELEIAQVVGVSAGAIAACMLATRCPWDNLRLRTKDAGRKVIDQLGKMPGTARTLYRAYAGAPLLPEAALRQFCRDVFGPLQSADGAALERLGQLAIPTAIVTASVRHTEKTVYSSTVHHDKRIEDAICDSCAIPFVFRTFKDNALLVDGAVVGNLPDSEVLRDPGGALVIGFGFGPEQSPEPKDAIGYAKGLIATAMASSVQDSMARIRSGLGAVCELPAAFDTFDFQAALEQGLEDAAFARVREQVRPQLVSAVRNFREQVRTNEDETALRGKVFKVHRQLSARDPYVVERSVMIVTANSARLATDPDHSDTDTITHIVEYRPKQAAISCVRLGLSTGSPPPPSGESDYRVERADGSPVNAVQVVASHGYQIGSATIPRFYALFFLEQPVAGAIRVIQRTRQDHAMQGLGVPGGREWLRSYNPSERDVTQVDLVLFYPEHIGAVSAVDLAENLNLLTAKQQPADANGMRQHWVRGRRMTEDELLQYARQLPPPGCAMVGWRAEAVQPAHYCGVLLQRP